jgi:undecaprenol kinase
MQTDPNEPPATRSRPSKNQPFAARLGYALAGIVLVARRERSFRTQTRLGAAAILAVAILRPGLLWAAIVILSAGLVLGLEMVNAALEYLIDRVHPDFAREIGFAKDAAAGAVLIAGTAAFCVGALMLLARFAG